MTSTRRRGVNARSVLSVVCFLGVVGLAAALDPAGRPAILPAQARADDPVRTAPAASRTHPPFEEPLDGLSLRSLLLPPSTAVDGVEVVGGVAARIETVDQYRSGYGGSTVPSGCVDARGILTFAGGEGDRLIARWANLRLPDVTLAGEQQVTRFDSESDAREFMQRQRDWFDRCSTVRYIRGSAYVDYRGSVDVDRSPDLLVATGAVSGASALRLELNGWVRVGPVVFAVELADDGTVARTELRRTGGKLLVTVERRLREKA